MVRGMLQLVMPHPEISTKAKVSTRQVRRIKHNIIHHGTVRRPKLSSQGRKRLMTEEMEEVRVFSLVCSCSVCLLSSTENHRNTLMKWLIFFGMNSMWCSQSRQSSAHFIVCDGVAKRYQFINASKPCVKSCRYNDVLLNVIQSSERSGFDSLGIMMPHSSSLWMSRPQMNVQETGNMGGHLLGSVPMNIPRLNGLNDGLFFQSIRRMVSWYGTSGRDRIRWSFSMISCAIKSFPFVRHIRGQDLFLSWIMRQSITAKYRNPCYIDIDILGTARDVW